MYNYNIDMEDLKANLRAIEPIAYSALEFCVYHSWQIVGVIVINTNLKLNPLYTSVLFSRCHQKENQWRIVWLIDWLMCDKTLDLGWRYSANLRKKKVGVVKSMLIHVFLPVRVVNTRYG